MPTHIKTFIPATERPDPRRVSEGLQKGSLKGPLKGSPKGFRRASEILDLEGVSRGPFKTPSNAFKKPSKTLQEGVEIDGALVFLGH